MATKLKFETREWTLTDEEIPKFKEKVKEYCIEIIANSRGDARSFRAIILMPRDRSVYDAFALSVRPHHQSDS